MNKLLISCIDNVSSFLDCSSVFLTKFNIINVLLHFEVFIEQGMMLDISNLVDFSRAKFILKCILSCDHPDQSVVQSWISANPGLKFHLLFEFVYFYTPFREENCFCMVQTRFLKKCFQVCKQAVGKFALNFQVNVWLG